MEVEIKLLLDPAAIADLTTHPAFAGSPPKSRRLSTTYFDTPELDLWRSGASLRVRTSAPGFVQTIKIDDASQQIGARGEWEWPVANGELDLELLNTLPRELHQRLDAAGRAGPLFTTRIDRQTWEFELEGSTRVEAALDCGTVRAGDRQAAIAEVELELKAGPPAPLLRLAIDLVDRYSLRYGSQSKSDRGYALLTDDLPPRHGVDTVALPDDVTVAGAFPVLLNGVLRAFAAEAPLAERGDVEGVHRMRAAIRKTRSLLVLFGPELEPHAVERFNANLRELGQALGLGRDWDVLLTETLPAAQRRSVEGVLDPLIREAGLARSRAQQAVAREVSGLGPTRLLLGLAAWVSEPGWFVGRRPERALILRLPKLLGRLEDKVRQRSRSIDQDDAETLHRLRKSLKKLRYALEFVSSLYPRSDVEAYLHPLKSLLAELGQVNDATVTLSRVDELAPAERPDLAPAAAALLSWNDDRRVAAYHKVQKKLHRLESAKPFWH